MPFQLAELTAKFSKEGDDIFLATLRDMGNVAGSIQSSFQSMGSMASSAMKSAAAGTTDLMGTIKNAFVGVTDFSTSTNFTASALKGFGDKISDVKKQISSMAAGYKEATAGGELTASQAGMASEQMGKLESVVTNLFQSLLALQDSPSVNLEDKLAFGSMAEEASGLLGKIEDLHAGLAGVSKEGETLSGSALGAVTTAVNDMGTASETVFGSMQKRLDDLIKSAGKLAGSTKDPTSTSAGGEAAGGKEEKKGFFSGIADKFKSALSGEVAESGKAAEGALNLVASAGETVRANLSQIAGIDLSVLTAGLLTIKGLVGLIANLFTTALSSNAGNLEAIQTSVAEIQSALVSMRTTVIDFIAIGFKDVVLTTMNIIADTVKVIQKWTKEVLEIIKANKDLIKDLGAVIGKLVLVAGSVASLNYALNYLIGYFTAVRVQGYLLAIPLTLIAGIKKALTPITMTYAVASNVVAAAQKTVTGAVMSAYTAFNLKKTVITVITPLIWAYQGALLALKGTMAALAITFYVVKTAVMVVSGAIMLYGGFLGYLGAAIGLVRTATLAWSIQLGGQTMVLGLWNAALIAAKVVMLHWQAAVVASQALTYAWAGAIKILKLAMQGLGVVFKGVLAATGVGIILALIGYLIDATGVMNILRDSTTSWTEKLKLIAGPLKDYLLPALDYVYRVIMEIYANARAGLMGLISESGNIVDTLIEATSDLGSTLLESIKPVWDLVVGFWNWIVNLFSPAIETAGEMAGGAVDGVSNSLGEVIGTTMSFQEIAQSVWDWLMVELSVIGKRVHMLILQVIIWIKQVPAVLAWLFDYASTYLTTLFKRWDSVLGLMWQTLKSYAAMYIAVWKEIWSFATGKGFNLGNITNQFQNELDKIKKKNSEIFKGIEMPKLDDYTQQVATAEKLKRDLIALEIQQAHEKGKRIYDEGRGLALEKKKTKGKDEKEKDENWSMQDLASVWRQLQERVVKGAEMSMEDLTKQHIKKTEENGKTLEMIYRALTEKKRAEVPGVTPR